jgi:predicted RNase H-like nuclease
MRDFRMRAVLGIDAAWTLTRASGVALASQTNAGAPWRLVAVAPSYQDFYALADGSEAFPNDNSPDPIRLLESSRQLCGFLPDLVAIDMPLARHPISGRRTSDNAVSSAYGARRCGTHTPSSIRPGRISDELTKGFAEAGFPLQTDSVGTPGLIEVYPHPALVELANAPERLCYKVSKTRRYWPTLDAIKRRERLFEVWACILELLDKQIAGVREKMPSLSLASGTRVADLKKVEDKLDAIVCAWVAIRAINGQATPFGDRDSAIWIPHAPASR